jgi:hypothetical protein
MLLEFVLLAFLIGCEDKKPHLFFEIAVSANNVKRINKLMWFNDDGH